MSNTVDHPKHYTSHASGVEAIEICVDLGFCLGNAVKYLFRAGLKGSALEDLKKCAWYLRREASRYMYGGEIPTMRRPKRLDAVLLAEKSGSVLGEVLVALFNDGIRVALERVDREIRELESAG